MEILSNFSSIYCFITFVIGAVFMLAILSIAAMGKVREPRNNVRFFVAKQHGVYGLILFLGKPTWDKNRLVWVSNKNNVKILATNFTFKYYNLNPIDFANMKAGEIREVFINLED